MLGDLLENCWQHWDDIRETRGIPVGAACRAAHADLDAVLLQQAGVLVRFGAYITPPTPHFGLMDREVTRTFNCTPGEKDHTDGVSLIKSLENKALRNLRAAEDSVPWFPLLRWLQTEAKRLPSDFNPKDYPGLMYCHLVNDHDQWKLFSYWGAEQFYRANGWLLERAAACDCAEMAGAVTNLRVQRQKWLSLRSLGTVVIGAAAIMGPFATVESVVIDILPFFLAARVAVNHKDPAMLKFVAGDQIQMPFHVVNDNGYGAAKVWVQSGSAKQRGEPSRTITLKGERQLISSCLNPAEQSVQAVVFGEAPSLKQEHGRQEIYDAQIAKRPNGN